MRAKRKHDKIGRSKGTLAPFAAMEHYVQNSLAYRKLPSTARAAYLEVLACYDGSNNGKIALSARELGDRLGMHKATASRALERLQLHGFVFVTQRSSFHRKLKLSAEYRLTAFKCDRTGELASKLFMRWNPEIQNTVAWAQLCGCTSATEDEKRRRKQTKQLHPCNQEGPNDRVHGCTHAPHLESAIPSAASHTASNAQPHTANQRAGVKASTLEARPLVLPPSLPTTLSPFDPSDALRPVSAIIGNGNVLGMVFEIASAKSKSQSRQQSAAA